jgi:hypothetical protein
VPTENLDEFRLLERAEECCALAGDRFPHHGNVLNEQAPNEPLISRVGGL